jgi:hypothetical protein
MTITYNDSWTGSAAQSQIAPLCSTAHHHQHFYAAILKLLDVRPHRIPVSIVRVNIVEPDVACVGIDVQRRQIYVCDLRVLVEQWQK